ncbi:MAG: dehydrogenase [Epsilonproteobacteria bacterium]|nr:dehydrogenase [Campylobacterota bacterium]NPA56867.1 dehydrogenase [Campylobacterota bacterium]
MNSQERLSLYAFLSRIFKAPLGAREVGDLAGNRDLLEMIGGETRDYFLSRPLEEIEEELNVDYTSLFIINSQPVETLVSDGGGEILVGLQNPVMFFYFQHGYEVDMNRTELLAPDHIAIEFGFMENLASRGEDRVAYQFLRDHLLRWVPPYLLALGREAETPFYREICDFTTEFLFTDYGELRRGDNGV